MKKLARIVAHLVSACAVLLLIIVPGNKYSWMQEMDPALAAGLVDHGAGSRTVFTSLVLIVIVATQVWLAVTAHDRRSRIVSLVVLAAAVSIWWLRPS